MTPERWAEINRVWHAVLARPQAERATAIAELSAGDEELRSEVELLLANLADASAVGFAAAPGLATASGSLVGARLGTYAVHALLGVGGMGEVYRAHDSTLGRAVALKILPDVWLDDPDRQARFDREARLLASLNHPNIGAIYGVHDSDGVKALVLELVDGETLAEHIHRASRASRRGLPRDEVTRIAAQIIDALEAAHERGIVHRDLKPGNIKITPDGRVKVLDFGLARGVTGGSNAPLAHSPTITVATQRGVLLGTAAYMSPEQARGRTVDKRTDIWAFGCVLYEMLTGIPAVGGDGVGDVLANVIKGEPEWRALPADTPAAMRLCIERCLKKNPRERFHDIADVRLAMDGAFDAASLNAEPHAGAGVRSGRLWPVLASVFAIAAAVAIWAPWRTPPVLEVTRFQIPIPEGNSFTGTLDLSPDGRTLVFGAQGGDGRRRIWIRDIDSLTARPIPGLELSGLFSGAVAWSTDSRSIVIANDNRLMKVDVSKGDPPVSVTKLSVPIGESSWNSQGDILIGGVTSGPIWRVSAAGGDATPVTRLVGAETAHGFPSFLPDGRRFLYFRVEAGGPSGHVHVGSIETSPEEQVTDKPLLASDSQAVYIQSGDGEPGWLLFTRGRRLLAQSFDPSKLLLTGEPQLVAAQVGGAGSRSFFSAVRGTVAFFDSASLEFALADRAGRLSERVGDSTEASFGTISPSGSHVAFDRVADDGNVEIWVTEVARDVKTRWTFDAARDEFPIWSPDGQRILFRSNRGGVFDLYEKGADVTEHDRLVLHTSFEKWPDDWSRDGRYVLYEERTTQDDLWLLPMIGDRTPIPVTRTAFQENHSRFSPDGRWISYQSDQSGRWEIYIRSFVPPRSNAGVASSAVYQVSRDGGQRAQWRQDGKELTYVGADNVVMAVDVTAATSQVTVGPPRALFRLPVFFEGFPRLDMRKDGQRFLIKVPARTGDVRGSITVTTNWQAALRR